jgi:hypothetical protein
MNIKMLRHVVTIAYGINIFGEDSNSSMTIGQGLTVTNEVILQAHAMNRGVFWLMHRHQHFGVNTRRPTADTLISYQLWKNSNIWERL